MTLAALLCCCTGAWATGELNGLFSVSATKQVQFSQGNLQYFCSTSAPEWRFAEHQYDYVAFDISAYAANSEKWIDLFAHGTSGYNNGQTNYQPYVVGAASNTYYQGNLTGNADWGYNAISNGGNTENIGWRTLTRDEWLYVFSGRSNAASKYGHGSINGTNGMILLPDSWTLPDGLSFTSGNSAWTNSYTLEQWSLMENAGAVFLPASGSCNSAGIPSESTQNQNGFYRASTAAYYMYFRQSVLQNCEMSFYQYGDAVRLVKDVPATITTAPTAIQDLTYTGSAQTLITAGEASGGTIKYSLDDVNWSESLPTGINWGVYTIRYYAEGDASHTDSEKQQISTLIGKAKGMYDLGEGPWTFSDVRTGWTGYEGAGTSISFNGLNDSKWFGSTYRSNDDDGCGYAYLGNTTQNSKYAVYSVYTHTENVPSYSRRVLTWRYKLLAWSSNLKQTTALYAANNFEYLKSLSVDFTEDYTDGSGSAYHLVHLTQESAWGAETSEQTGWFGFDNRSGSTAADKTSALLLTQVIGDNTGVSNYVHNWGSFKHVSSSWSTYYYKHITFNANGGEGSMAVQEIENSGTLTANAFTRMGYSFAGWATSENGDVVYADGAEITATSDDKGPVTLYAKWTANTISYTVPSSGIGTFSIAYNFTVPVGLTAHYCKTYDAGKGTISVVAIDGVVPANTGVLLKGEPSETYTLTGTDDDAATVTGNALVAVVEATHVDDIDGLYTNFMMKGGKFIKIASSTADVKMPANRAYLQILTSDLPIASARDIVLSWDEDEPTGINEVRGKKEDVRGEIYNLSGQRVSKPTKGLYIIGGKKVFIP